MLQLQPGRTVGYGPKHKIRFEGNASRAVGQSFEFVVGRESKMRSSEMPGYRKDVRSRTSSCSSFQPSLRQLNVETVLRWNRSARWGQGGNVPERGWF